MIKTKKQKVTEIMALLMSSLFTPVFIWLFISIAPRLSNIYIIILVLSSCFFFIALYLFFTYKYIKRKQIYKKPFPSSWREILLGNVVYYNSLNEDDRYNFEKRVQIFLGEKLITPIATEIDDKVRVLVASSAIIPIFKLPEWFEYRKLNEILIYPDKFNENYNFSEDQNIMGMVVHNTGSVILSKKSLIYGFQNSKDSSNVGIHEFIHKIDEEDGNLDGIPSYLMNRNSFDMMQKIFEIERDKIKNKKSVINPYAATNIAEFFCVVGEYFFEDPKLLKSYNEELYNIMKSAFHQDTSEIIKDIILTPFKKNKKIGRNSPCPCGSGKKYKKCCLLKK